jgi:hypothetical protein
MAEVVGRRILGAIRPLDAVTGAPIRTMLKLSGPGLAFQRTRTGAYAIIGAAGLEAHAGAFEAPPATPPAEALAFAVEIEDPDRRYLPAVTAIRLPRPWDPANGVRDLMEPIGVALAPSAARDLAPAWAGLLAVVRDEASNSVRGALVEVFPAGATTGRLGWGLTESRGQALAAVPGLPFMRDVENDPNDPEDDTVVTADTPVDVRVRAHADRRWPVDPTVLAAGGDGIRSASLGGIGLSPGRIDHATLTLDLS